MTYNLDTTLCLAAPQLYRDRHASMMSTCMCWGFDCGDGWFIPILQASVALEALITSTYPNLKAVQVKEKYGGLRFYLNEYYDDAEAIVSTAEDACDLLCEQCGTAECVSRNQKGWIITLCATCRQAHMAERLQESEMIPTQLDTSTQP